MTRASTLGPLVVVLVSVVLAGACAGRDPEPQQVAVPAYWTPASPDGRAMFDRLVRTGPAVGLVVVNGSRSAPELPYDPAWGDTVRALSAAGTRPLGYVDTGYVGLALDGPGKTTRVDGPGLGRSAVDAWTAQIGRDVDDWYATYGGQGLGGVFLDRTTALCGPRGTHVALYRAVVERIRDRHPGAYVVLNPGRTVERCYRDVGDVLVTFEGPYDEYLRWSPADWERDLPPQRFWHLVYGAADADAMTRAVALSKERHAGYVYVTDGGRTVADLGHPWDALPAEGYWQAQVAAARRGDPVAAAPHVS